jgi:hypothetical protein
MPITIVIASVRIQHPTAFQTTGPILNMHNIKETPEVPVSTASV